MHDKVMGGVNADEEFDTTDAQDARDQGEVLREVLLIYPEAMTLDELTRYLTVASTEFSELDRIHRAVRDLTAGGLLHRPELIQNMPDPRLPASLRESFEGQSVGLLVRTAGDRRALRAAGQGRSAGAIFATLNSEGR